MSAADEEEAADEVCANCGRAEVDEVKLKICTACKLVKYCSVDCQKIHRPQHKKQCKQRMSEIRDDRLFTQPEISHYGECPICCLPLPLDLSKSKINSCCCKRICKGCSYANKKREIEQGLKHRCPYCREPIPKSQEEAKKNNVERARVNDPVAIVHIGAKCLEEGQYNAAFEYFSKAAELGDIMAHYNLSIMYRKGLGVEKNLKKEMYHLEEAAIGGHPSARYNLGIEEHRALRMDRSKKHYIIAAKLGHDGALEAVKKLFSVGLVSKEDYEAVLRGHQAAADATKSDQREEGYAFYSLPPEEQIL